MAPRLHLSKRDNCVFYLGIVLSEVGKYGHKNRIALYYLATLIPLEEIEENNSRVEVTIHCRFRFLVSRMFLINQYKK